MPSGPSEWKRVMLGSPETPEPVAPPPAMPQMASIDPGCEIEGKLVLERSIRVEGEFRGSIHSGETVSVGPQAAVQADLEARSIEIHGAVVGNLKASREVVLHPGSRLHGDIETPSLVIERGAFCSGETRMFRPELGLREDVGASAGQASPDA